MAVPLGEVAEGEGDHDPGHGQHQVGAPLEDPARATGVADGQQGDRQCHQRTDDAVAASVHIGNLALMAARGLDDAAGGGVDDGGNAA